MTVLSSADSLSTLLKRGYRVQVVYDGKSRLDLIRSAYPISCCWISACRNGRLQWRFACGMIRGSPKPLDRDLGYGQEEDLNVPVKPASTIIWSSRWTSMSCWICSAACRRARQPVDYSHRASAVRRIAPLLWSAKRVCRQGFVDDNRPSVPCRSGEQRSIPTRRSRPRRIRRAAHQADQSLATGGEDSSCVTRTSVVPFSRFSSNSNSMMVLRYCCPDCR